MKNLLREGPWPSQFGAVSKGPPEEGEWMDRPDPQDFSEVLEISVWMNFPLAIPLARVEEIVGSWNPPAGFTWTTGDYTMGSSDMSSPMVNGVHLCFADPTRPPLSETSEEVEEIRELCERWHRELIPSTGSA